MSLSLENRVLLSLIAETSFGKKLKFLENGENLSDINWDIVYKESVKQTVVLFVSGAISNYAFAIPKEIYGKWLANSSKAIANNMAVIQCQSELVDFLKKNNYKYIILKGLASSSYYENPDMRMLGDVDFLIDNDISLEIGNAIQEKLGYEIYGMESHERHLSMTRGKNAIEMHYEIPGIPNGEKGEIARNFVEEILDNTIMSQIDGECFSAPAPLYHGTIILLHMLHHMMSEGLGLRHLCDWGAFVNKTANDSFWGTDFLPFLKALGLVKYAEVMASVCHKFFDINTPSCLAHSDLKLCEDIMEDILNSGNFGNKDQQYHQSGWIVSENGKDGVKKSTFSVVLGRLDSAVKLHWPWLKKWKLLLPFAYVIFTVRYYLKVICGERPSLSSLMPEANRRKELYKQLEIYEDEK